jgi:hypothetical protein
MTNKRSKRRRISRPVTDPCREKGRNAVFSNAFLVVRVGTTHDIVKFDHKITKNSKGENVLSSVTGAGEDHGLPAINAARHPPAACSGFQKGVNNNITISEHMASVVATRQTTK